MKKLLAIAATLLSMPGVAKAQTLPNYFDSDTIAGTPNAMQFQTLRDDLNLIDVQPEGEDRTGPEGDSDTIGATLNRWGIKGQNGERYDLHYQHAQRVFEGSRARLIIDVPVNIDHADTEHAFGSTYPGATAVSGTINAGLEVPVQPNWLVTPRVSYGVALAGSYFNGNGELATGSLTSRYQIRHVGRGELIIGNAVAYSHSTHVFASQPAFAPVINWAFRNGVAYQLPLKSRMFGRQASLRASYVFTISTKDPLLYKRVHELGVSIGVRTREAEQKNRFEQLRIGFLFTHANDQFFSFDHYNAYSLTLGYRF